MVRKIKEINQELLKANKKLREVQALKEEAEKEEQDLINSVNTLIEETSKEKNVWVGVVLTKADLVSIIGIALETGESIRIASKVYINE